MNNKKLSPWARAYIGVVLCAGLAAAARLVAAMSAAEVEWPAVIVFCALGLIASAISISYQGSMPTRITHQIGSSFAYPLLILVDPGAACLVFAAMTVADKVFNRRGWISTAFNMAQLSVSCWCAVVVRQWLVADWSGLTALDSASILGAIVLVLTFATVNHCLTQGVISLVNRRPFLHWSWFTRTGILNETLCVVSGLGMAVFWRVSPWLVLLGVIPIWTTMLMILMLTRREIALETRESELKSLQRLGLEIGSELDVERLRGALLRIACQATEASGAFLGQLDEDGWLVVQAHRGMADPPANRLELGETEQALLASGKIRCYELSGGEAHEAPTFSTFDASGMLLAPLDINGERVGLLVLLHGPGRRPFDESDLRRLDNLVRFANMALSNAKLVTDLTQMQSRLIQSEKMSALGMMISGVAHELNNPLTSVLGYGELMMRQEDDPQKSRMLDRVVKESKRAGRIVQNLLTFSRKHKPEKKLCDINEVVADVLEFRSYELSVRNVEIIERLEPQLPRVLVDPHQFQQIFLNLITNAQQALDECGGPRRITVGSRVRDGKVQITVADNGPGIDPADLRQIFVPFFTTKEVGRGTGLGLAICYGIVEEHGGRIEVESEKGNGATFIVEIPIADEAELSVPAEETCKQPAELDVRGRLLVVDDEESIAQLVQEYFEAKGWDVRTASEGGEALEQIRENRFDVLVVDLRMPGMDGQELFERLRRSEPDLARRIVFATGDPGSGPTGRFLEALDNQVLHKPYNLDEVCSVVSRVVAQDGSVEPLNPRAGAS